MLIVLVLVPVVLEEEGIMGHWLMTIGFLPA